jgi:hypothetical protein
MERYLAHYWGVKNIVKIEIERETEKSYWIEGRRQDKFTRYSKLCATYAEAKDFILNEQIKRIESAKSQLAYLENDLAKIKTL